MIEIGVDNLTSYGRCRGEFVFGHQETTIFFVLLWLTKSRPLKDRFVFWR